MSIEEIRAIQKNRQINAIDRRRSAESIKRIGDRDPLTGQFQVLDPDGGVSPQGVKVYNAQEQYGDRVLPFPRTDGTIALDSEKGSVIKTPTAFPHCPGYLYGQVFNCEVPKKKKKGLIHILFADQGKLWVGGHQTEAQEVVFPPASGNPGWLYDLWADRSGWIVVRRSSQSTSLVQSYDSDGTLYSSAAHPDNQFWDIPNLLTSNGFIGFGMVSLLRSVGIGGFQMARALWLRGEWAFNWAAAPDPNFILDIPVAMFPPLTITRINENIDDLDAAYTKEYLAVARDRTSTLIFHASEDNFSGESSGYHELIQSDGTAQQIWPWNGTQIYKPTGMYTNGTFTQVLNVTEINNLKSGDGLVSTSITQIDRTTTTKQVQGLKIPSTAVIQMYVSIFE